MNAKTVSERVATHRANLRAAGLVKIELWVHPNDVTRLKKEADSLAARRARLLAQGLERPSMEEEEARLIAAAKKVTRRYPTNGKPSG